LYVEHTFISEGKACQFDGPAARAAQEIDLQRDAVGPDEPPDGSF
jgi:hypothetical protein